MIREFHLSPRGDRGLSCDVDGAFVGAVPLLHRSRGEDEWQPRDSSTLSDEMGVCYGLPIDMAPKSGGLQAIAKALNEGDIARAQIAAVLLGIPDPPPLSKGATSRSEMIALIRDLHWSGMLKWDPDEHPRWPAGSTDGKGGEFAPKGESGKPDDADRNPRIQLADAGMSDASDDPVAEALSAAVSEQIHSVGGPVPALGVDEQPVDETSLQTDDSGIYADYGDHIGGVQLASTAIPIGALGITGAKPANWENLTRLADGSLELGSGQIITAASLLSALDQSRERNAVRSAITKFGLNPSQAVDVLAARAYVWANNFAPWNFVGVPTSGPGLESVSRSIMQVELARPGTLYLALQGDRLSTAYLKTAAQDGLNDAAVLESRIRLPNAPKALQSMSGVARGAASLKSNDGMRAHHLVPVNIIGRNLDLAALASEAGWQTDGADNVIGLPGNPEKQMELASEGKILPMQISAHPLYDKQTQEQIQALRLRAGSPLTPIKARSILDDVAKENRRQIISGMWQPALKSS